MNSYVQTREKVPDIFRATGLSHCVAPVGSEGDPRRDSLYSVGGMGSWLAALSALDRKTRILKGFRTKAPGGKSFLDRPLLLALLYPMNIEFRLLKSLVR